MFEPYELLLIILGYLLLLFLVAYYAHHRESTGRSIVSNPVVYALSLAVYCTSWTFYGSVGKAANSGLDFLTIYIGPTLMASLWWIVLRKIVGIAKRNRITTISDFIGSRYGNSILLSALVTLIAVIGITPYIGLQIKAIINTFTLCTGHPASGHLTGVSITILLGIFSIIFGARRLDIAERHGGMIFAIAFESLVKLLAFLAVGVFVTYGLFGGFGEIFAGIQDSGFDHLLRISGEGGHVRWLSLTFLSMMAILFLPRQFHVAVVENSDVRHIRKAMWLFPLYLLLINVFVMPVAFGGLLSGISPAFADSFMLLLPLSKGSKTLTLVAFLGGFSAATAMIIVESLALSTMVMNSLVIPALYRFSDRKGFSVIVLNIKRLVILACVFSGFAFAVLFGKAYSLVDMGLKSFEAVSLFAVPLLGGLYWRRGNRRGATAGLVGGFLVWLYTLIVPALMKTGLLDDSRLLDFFARSELLRPTALLGLEGLDKWSHSLFWSLSVNALLYFGISMFTRPSEEDTAQAFKFVEMMAPDAQPVGRIRGLDSIGSLLSRYMGAEEGRRAFARILRERLPEPAEEPSPQQLQLIRNDAERILSGAIGSSIATLIFKESAVLSDRERQELSDSIERMASNLRLSRQELAGANRKLAELQAFTENIIESLPIGISTIDAEGRITYWNAAMETLTGIAKERAATGDIRELLGDLNPCFLAPEIRTGEFLCKTPSTESPGEEQIIKIYISPFRGIERGYVLAFEDITEKKRMERELALASKHASIGRLTAGVSHEIGNPLAAISSLVQELGELDLGRGEDAEFARNSYEVIKAHLERIARIVRSLGDFARTSSPEKEICELGEIIERTLQLVRYDKKARNIRIQADMKEGLRFRGNADQIQQVALNIMLNAMDAMPSGGRLRVSAARRDRFAELVIEDDGVGIEPEIIDRIFDPFFTTKPLGRGTGLGLSICYGIISEHGGTIKVKSTKGEGTAFTIRLPLAVPDTVAS